MSSLVLRSNNCDLYDVKSRLETFHNWRSLAIQPKALAEEGFYYKDVMDNVECAFCKLGLNDFEENDDIQKLHKEYSPNCSVIVNRGRREDGGIGLDGEDVCGTQAASDSVNVADRPDQRECTYSWHRNLQTRINSFADWPQLMPQRPETLASAGFFYTGMGDQCICFHCGLGLKSWETDDDPFVEHARYSPKCEYLLSKKDAQFVEECLKKNEKKDESNDPANGENADEAKTPPAAEEKQTADELLCKLCYHQKASMVAPCGHVVCIDCSYALDQCPFCRQNVAGSFRRIFL